MKDPGTCFPFKKTRDRELPVLKELVDRFDIDMISVMVDSVIQTDDRLAKQIKLYFCHKYSGLKLKEIGKYFDKYFHDI